MHFVSKACNGEVCRLCRNLPATHKLAEVVLFDDPLPGRHELVAYACCGCFGRVFGVVCGGP